MITKQFILMIVLRTLDASVVYPGESIALSNMTNELVKSIERAAVGRALDFMDDVKQIVREKAVEYVEKQTKDIVSKTNDLRATGSEIVNYLGLKDVAINLRKKFNTLADETMKGMKNVKLKVMDRTEYINAEWAKAEKRAADSYWDEEIQYSM